MGWYRKFVFDACQNVRSKLVSKNPIHAPAPRVHSNCNSSFYNPCKSSGIFGSPSISSKFGGHLNGLKQNESGLISGVTRRYYCVHRDQVHHFKSGEYKKWFQNTEDTLIVAVVSSVALITVFCGSTEVVPYTKRKHIVILSSDSEKLLGESTVKKLKERYKGKILPDTHPDSVKVRLIAKEIIDALQRGLSNEQVWSDASEGDVQNESPSVETSRNEGEVLNDKWLKESRKQGEMQGVNTSIQHLEGLNWEVLVVDEPTINAFCAPGGKIVVFTGLLKHFKTAAEIATVIGHEVGHAVARHVAEKITKNLWLAILELILYQFVTPDIVNAMSNFLLKLPFSRKMEMEADYIGLLLLASAGYDPRVAPQVYKKQGEVAGGDSVLKEYLSTHPSGKKTAQLLTEAHVMKEALAIYCQANAGRGVEGFL